MRFLLLPFHRGRLSVSGEARRFGQSRSRLGHLDESRRRLFRRPQDPGGRFLPFGGHHRAGARHGGGPKAALGPYPRHHHPSRQPAGPGGGSPRSAARSGEKRRHDRLLFQHAAHPAADGGVAFRRYRLSWRTEAAAGAGTGAHGQSGGAGADRRRGSALRPLHLPWPGQPVRPGPGGDAEAERDDPGAGGSLQPLGVPSRADFRARRTMPRHPA